METTGGCLHFPVIAPRPNLSEPLYLRREPERLVARAGGAIPKNDAGVSVGRSPKTPYPTQAAHTRSVESYGLNKHPHAAEAYSARKPGPISTGKISGILESSHHAPRDGFFTRRREDYSPDGERRQRWE